MTDLYRHFDASGRLLYVGISFGAVARLQSHKRDGSEWFNMIARVEVEKFHTRSAAKKAERKAIREERPIYNKAHKGRPIPKRRKQKASKVLRAPKMVRRKPVLSDHPPTYAFVVARHKTAIAEMENRYRNDDDFRFEVDAFNAWYDANKADPKSAPIKHYNTIYNWRKAGFPGLNEVGLDPAKVPGKK